MVFFIFVFALQQGAIQNINQTFQAFMAPFNIFIYPGFFFYKANFERYMNDCLGYCQAVKKEPMRKPKASESASSEAFFDKVNHKDKTYANIECRRQNRWCCTYRQKYWFGQCMVVIGLLLVIVFMSI